MGVYTYTFPCDSVDVDEQTSELREVVDRFDNLFEDCWRKRLASYEERELDQLYQLLLNKEAELWRETSLLLIDQVTEFVDIPFPLLRYTIGMLP